MNCLLGSVQESNDLEDGSNRDEGAEIDETNEDNSNDEDNDEISLSSDDSDVEVVCRILNCGIGCSLLINDLCSLS